MATLERAIETNIIRLNYLQRELSGAAKATESISKELGAGAIPAAQAQHYKEALRKIKVSIELIDQNVG